MNIFFQCFNFYFIDDHCQYWLNKADGTLTSPNFKHTSNYHSSYYHSYDHNLNCIWILNADQGFYLTLEFDFLMVNHNDTKMTFISTSFLINFIILDSFW